MKSSLATRPSPADAAVRLNLGDRTLQAEFDELVPCDFPLWTAESIPVELPPEGRRSYVRGRGSWQTGTAHAGVYPHLVRMPRYRSEQLIARESGPHKATEADPRSELLATAPVFAIAASAGEATADGPLVQSAAVLLVWQSWASVLVTVQWSEGHLAEDGINREWTIRAGEGQSLELGLAQLVAEGSFRALSKHAERRLYVAPALLGAHALGNEGAHHASDLWRRVWRFETADALRAGLEQVAATLRAAAGDAPSRKVV